MFAPQEPERRSGVKCWSWIRLQPGEKFLAWIAGSAMGFHMHFLSGSKPCVSRLTGGALKCRYDRAGLIPTWRCYFPLLDTLGARRVIALNADYAPPARALPLHTAVTVSKLKLFGGPLAIEEDARRELWEPRDAEEERGYDLRTWLLQVWHDPDLVAWVNANPILELPLRAPARADAVKKQQQRREQEEADKADAESDRQKVKKLLADRAKYVPADPCNNGKHLR